MKAISQITLSSIIISLAIIALLGCNSSNINKKKEFRFVFMTDIHLQPELNAVEGYKKAIDSINALHPDFVITGGDLIMDALATSYERADSLYNLYDSINKHLTMPVYNTIGNHEIFGIYKESGISTDHPEYGEVMYKNRVGEGKTYSSFDHKGWHFMLLDAIGITPEGRYIGQIDSLQMEWIKSDLQKIDTATPIVISTHIPFVSATQQILKGGTAALAPSLVITNSRQVLDLFKNHNLKLVLQGHLHFLEEIVVYDIHFITGGAVCGSWWNGSRSGIEEGFMVVDVKGDDFTWEYVDYGWEATNN